MRRQHALVQDEVDARPRRQAATRLDRFEQSLAASNRRGASTSAPTIAAALALAEVGDRRLVAEAQLEPRLQDTVVCGELARDVRVLEQDAVRVLEVNRLRPLVVDDGRQLDALGDELGPLLLELRVGPGFEREVVYAFGHAERTVETAVELDRNAGDAAWLHEGQELLLARVEEDVADLAAFLHRDDVAADGLEPEDPLVERPRRVHVERPEAHVRPAFVRHGRGIARARSCRPAPAQVTIVLAPREAAGFAAGSATSFRGRPVARRAKVLANLSRPPSTENVEGNPRRRYLVAGTTTSSPPSTVE